MNSFFRFLCLLPLVAALACDGSGTPPVQVAPVVAKQPVNLAERPEVVELPVEDRVEHHQYKAWANCPIGTKVVVKEITTHGETQSESLTTYTLKERNDKLAVVTTQGNLKDPMGIVHQLYPQDLEFIRWVRGKTEQERARASKPDGATEEKEETVTVLGKEYKAKVYVSKGHVEAGDTETRTWISREIPGGIAKSERRVIQTKRVTTTEILEIKYPTT